MRELTFFYFTKHFSIHYITQVGCLLTASCVFQGECYSVIMSRILKISITFKAILLNVSETHWFNRVQFSNNLLIRIACLVLVIYKSICSILVNQLLFSFSSFCRKIITLIHDWWAIYRNLLPFRLPLRCFLKHPSSYLTIIGFQNLEGRSYGDSLVSPLITLANSFTEVCIERCSSQSSKALKPQLDKLYLFSWSLISIRKVTNTFFPAHSPF